MLARLCRSGVWKFGVNSSLMKCCFFWESFFACWWMLIVIKVVFCPLLCQDEQSRVFSGTGSNFTLHLTYFDIGWFAKTAATECLPMPNVAAESSVWFPHLHPTAGGNYSASVPDLCRRCWWQTWICQWEPGNGVVGCGKKDWGYKDNFDGSREGENSSITTHAHFSWILYSTMFTIVWPFPAKLSLEVTLVRIGTNKPQAAFFA